MKPYLSVVIPTFNRAEKLEKTLERLHAQSLSVDAYEIIVVNDGSTDQTEQLLRKWSEKSPLVRFFHQTNSGQGVARNHAIKKAEGEVVLFIGDDIYATPDFLLSHVRFHQDHAEENFACLGLTEWEEPATRFMRWLTNGGPQFAYSHLSPNKPANFWYFYTSNLSIKTSLLKKEYFDESFKAYGWEDIELGYRLEKNHNLQLIYTPSALASHDHSMEEKDLERKMKAIGSTALLFQSKHPKLMVVPRGSKKILLQLITSSPILFLVEALSLILGKEMYWYVLSKRYFLQGVNSL